MLDAIERSIPFQILLPKNFSRVNPLIYITIVAMFFVVFGIIWYGYLRVLMYIGLFIVGVYALALFFWRNPLF